MTSYQILVLKSLIQILRGIGTLLLHKDSKVSKRCYEAAKEIEKELEK